MKELKINLQGSWRRVLAMITVAAMCFSVVGISPAFAQEDNSENNLKPVNGVTFTAVTSGDASKVKINLPEEMEKAEVVTGGELTLTGAATIKVDDDSAVKDFTTDGYTVTWSAEKKTVESAKEAQDQESSEESLISEDGVFKANEVGTYTVTLKVTESTTDQQNREEAKGLTDTLDVEVVENKEEEPQPPVEDPENPVSPGEVVTTVEAVKVSKTATELTVGGTEKLTAKVTVSPADAEEPAVAWKSSNEKIATVAADGTVKAIAVGTANITATAKIGDSVATGACAVTVKAAANNAQGNNQNNTQTTEKKSTTAAKKATVVLNAKKLTMKKGTSTKALAVKSASIKGDKIKTVKSSNKKVVTATVKNGKTITLKAKKTGKATITVTMKSGAKATVKVTVNNKKVVTKKITLNKKKATLKVKKSVKLTVTRNPINANEKITWSSSNKKIATVKNGKVVAKKKGKVTITAKTSNGKKATCKITVKK